LILDKNTAGTSRENLRTLLKEKIEFIKEQSKRMHNNSKGDRNVVLFHSSGEKLVVIRNKKGKSEISR